MIGAIFKYTLAAVAGAVIFATCMHVADEEALNHIRDMIDAHAALSRAKGLDGEELKTEMVNFIHSHRQAWDKTYIMAETGRSAQLLYGHWV
jgi:hypothetical protein